MAVMKKRYRNPKKHRISVSGVILNADGTGLELTVTGPPIEQCPAYRPGVVGAVSYGAGKWELTFFDGHEEICIAPQATP